MPKYSKLQKEVFKLYKDFLKVSQNKPGIREIVRSEFRKNARIPKTDILRIENLLRRSFRQLDQVKKPNVTGVQVFTKQSSNKQSKPEQ